VQSLTANRELRLFGRVIHPFWNLLGALAVAGLVAGCAGEPKSAPDWTLTDLSGNEVRWSSSPDTRAVVFVFTGVECPIANRAQPELTRLAREFTPEVTFVAVYPNASEDAAMIRRHRTTFELPPEAYRDPRQHLAKTLGATVTPEVVALAVDGRLIYRGRVNDQFAGLGLGRPAPTRHDLKDALRDFIEGKLPSGIVTSAAGCRIQTTP
jgi:Redoxin